MSRLINLVLSVHTLVKEIDRPLWEPLVYHQRLSLVHNFWSVCRHLGFQVRKKKSQPKEIKFWCVMLPCRWNVAFWLSISGPWSICRKNNLNYFLAIRLNHHSLTTKWRNNQGQCQVAQIWYRFTIIFNIWNFLLMISIFNGIYFLNNAPCFIFECILSDLATRGYSVA